MGRLKSFTNLHTDIHSLIDDRPQELTLHFVVLSFDRYSRDEIIGEVVSPLAQIDLREPVTLSRQINPRSLKVRPRISKSLFIFNKTILLNKKQTSKLMVRRIDYRFEFEMHSLAL